MLLMKNQFESQSYYILLQNIMTIFLDLTVRYLSIILDYCLQPSYNYNPHQHVKIWLSNDRNSFLTLINQLRLVKMRNLNPADTINLVYDSRLLSDEALANLKTFCQKHNIVVHDIPKKIIPFCKTKEEEKLIQLYQDEIFNLEQGGNLGVASDLLRMLEAVYSLGTYSDFDVHIDTKKLPPLIQIKEPFLFSFDKKNVLFCTDILIIANSLQTLPVIQIIQHAMIRACTAKVTPKTQLPMERFYFELHKPECLKKILFGCLDLGYSSREYRWLVSKLDAHIAEAMYDKRNLLSCTEFVDLLRQEKTWSEEDVKCKKEFEFWNELASTYRNNIMLHAVMNSTGPTLFINTISQCSANDIWNRILIYRTCGFLATYQLDEFFKGQIYNINHKLPATNDISWLPRGMQRMQKQEEKMNDSAHKITNSFVRFFYKSKKIASDSTVISQKLLSPSLT